VATRADIVVAVQGIKQVQRAQNSIEKLSTQINNLNKSASRNLFKKVDQNIGNLVLSTDNLNRLLNEARKNFNSVAVGTPQATKAAKQFVKQEQLLNKALAKQEKLLEKIRRQQKGKEFTRDVRSKTFKKNQIKQSDGSFINQRRAELQITNRAATLDNRINQILLKRGKILSSNGKKIINNNKARNAGGRGGGFQNALSSGLIGGGFPLLFGQGPTAALGGALGGVAGGAIGGQFGFALSIAGTTIGSALDDLANALSKPTQNIQSLVDKLGLANTPTGDLALRLEKVGLSASAADLLLNEFNKKFGRTPEDIKRNTKQMNKFKNQINELGTAITLLLSKVLSPAIETILNFIDRQAIGNKIGRAKASSLELKAAGLATKETKEKFNFKFGAVEGPLAGKDVEKFFKEREKQIFNDLVNEEINKQLVAQGKSPIEFKLQESNFDDKFDELQKKAEQAEFDQNIRSLQQSLKLEKDRLNISSQQFTLKQEQFKLDNLNADLELLKTELGKDNNDEIQKQVDGLQAQVNLQEQIVNNAKALTDPFREISNIISQDIGDGIKGLIKGTETLNNVLNNVINKIADAALNMAIFGNTAGKFEKGGGILGLLPFADGGSPPVGRPSIVGEKGPELFVPRSSGNIIPNNKLGGGNTNNVVVNVDASGSDVQGDEAAAKEIGTLISVAVQGELLKQQRPGGLLSR